MTWAPIRLPSGFRRVGAAGGHGHHRDGAGRRDGRGGCRGDRVSGRDTGRGVEPTGPGRRRGWRAPSRSTAGTQPDRGHWPWPPTRPASRPSPWGPPSRPPCSTPGTPPPGRTSPLLCEADGNDDVRGRRGRACGRHRALPGSGAAQRGRRARRAWASTDAADEAYRRSLLTQPATSFVVDWPRGIDIGDGRIADVTDPSWQLNLLLARHSTGEPIDPRGLRGPGGPRARLRCDRRPRRGRAVAGSRRSPSTPKTFEPRTWPWSFATPGVSRSSNPSAIAEVVRGRPFPDRDPGAGPRSVRDVGSLRTYPARRVRQRRRSAWPRDRAFPGRSS